MNNSVKESEESSTTDLSKAPRKYLRIGYAVENITIGDEVEVDYEHGSVRKLTFETMELERKLGLFNVLEIRQGFRLVFSKLMEALNEK